MNKEQAAEKEIIIKALEQGLAVCYDCSPKPDGVISHLRMAIKTYKEKFAGWDVQGPTFTRAQVCIIALAMGNHFDKIPTLEEMMEYMNTNYPEPK